MHGIFKRDFRTVQHGILRELGSCLAACGDVNRNVMAPQMPFKNKPEYMHAQELAKDIADLLTPQTGAYFDMWFNGEKAFSLEDTPELSQLKEWAKSNDHTTRDGKNRYPIYGRKENPEVTKARLADPTGK